MKKLNKSLIVAFLLTMIGALLIGGATVAWFTSQDTNTDNSFAAGTLEISLDKEDQVEKYFEVGNMQPGDEGSTEIVVTNEGTLPLDFSFTLETSGALFDGEDPLQVKINDIAGNKVTDPSTEHTLEANETRTFVIFYLMPGDADNDYQGAAGSLNIIVNANQVQD